MNAASSTLRAAIAVAMVATLAGCATRYDAAGNQIYRWQFGQDNLREIDYSDPRLPILPRWRPSTQLWPIPSPYEFNDLSRFSFLDEPPVTPMIASTVGDNTVCAACKDSTARPALVVARADARGGRAVR